MSNIQRALVSMLGLVGTGSWVGGDRLPFHTSPYCWSEARIHSEVRPPGPTLRVERLDEAAPRPTVLSPNGAYAFAVLGPERDDGDHPHYEVRVFNERPYLLRIDLADAHSVRDPKWINEQLLFFRVWWGRVAGSDFILDVEREDFVHQSGFRYGALAFQQYKQCASPQWRDAEHCRCLVE